jgi:signal transduction histidine kinase
MVVQAGGARRLLDADPDRARESILNVERTGRDALAEMRALLGLLRKDDDPRALTPQPGLEQLPHLAAALSEGGLACDLQTVGTPIELTPGVDLAGFRVIEAALELLQRNHYRHGAVIIRWHPRHLELAVSADGPLRDGAESLRPVAERVELYGGRLDVSDDEGARAAITCVLPLTPVTA